MPLSYRSEPAAAIWCIWSDRTPCARYTLGEQPAHLRNAREKDATSPKPSSNPIAFIGQDEFNNMSFASFSFFMPTNEA